MSSELKVHEWEVYCTTDSVNRSVWAPDMPTLCPDNINHTISTDPPPRIIQIVSDRMVKIIEEDGVTQGIYKFKGYKKQIPAGTPGNVTTILHTFPFPISLINGWFIAKDDMEDDTINLTVAEDMVIGAIAAPVYTGNSEITVTSTVIDNIYKGYNLKITDGVNSNDLGQVLDINVENSTLTLENPAANTFNPLSPSYILMSVNVIEDFHIPVGKQRYAFAEKKVGGKYLPAGIPISVKYTNNSGNAKTFAYNMEYLY